MLAALSADIPGVATGTGGEGTWKPEWNERLRGKDVFVIYDVDSDGRRGSRKVATSLAQAGITVFVVELPLNNTERDGKDLSDYLSLNSVDDLRALLVAARDDDDMGDTGQPWEPPTPFHAFSLPPFPVKALPDHLSRFVEALATATQTPAALVGGQVLTVCAVGLGGRVEVEIRPGWREPTNIFTVTVLAPGNRKTAVVSAVTKPVLEFEQEEARRLAPEISEAEAQRRILKRRVADLEKQAAKAEPENRLQLEREAIAVAQELSSVIVPPSPRVFTDDVTPEQLANLISNHEGRFALLSAEGGIFDTLAGRYSGKGEPNIDVFLKGHAGDPLRVDRVGRAPDLVDRPSLTVGLAVQPDVLRRLEAKPGFRGRGLLARFLYAVPESMMGRRQIGTPAVPDDLLREFHATIRTLLRFSPANDSEGRPTPHILRFDRTAQDAFRTFEAGLEPRLASDADLGPIADWGAKLAGLSLGSPRSSTSPRTSITPHRGWPRSMPTLSQGASSLESITWPTPALRSRKWAPTSRSRARSTCWPGYAVADWSGSPNGTPIRERRVDSGKWQKFGRPCDSSLITTTSGRCPRPSVAEVVGSPVRFSRSTRILRILGIVGKVVKGLFRLLPPFQSPIPFPFAIPIIPTIPRMIRGRRDYTFV